MLTLRERFESKVERLASGCWQWTGAILDTGYGVLTEGGKNGKVFRAHRVAYELFIGPIPEGLVLDHLCHNRWCVNPEHLEAVTNHVNVLRGNMPGSVIHRQKEEPVVE